MGEYVKLLEARRGIVWPWVAVGAAAMLGLGFAALAAGCATALELPGHPLPEQAAALGCALADGVLPGSAFGLWILAVASATALDRARRRPGAGRPER